MFASFVDLLQSIQQFVAHFCEFIYVLLFSFCIHFALQRQLLTHTYINAYCRIRELQCARFFSVLFSELSPHEFKCISSPNNETTMTERQNDRRNDKATDN